MSFGETSRELTCRLCGSESLRSVVDLGATPPCESFLTPERLDIPENTFPLHLRICEKCLLLQIPALITPEDTFTEYAYFSSYSDSWVEHARRLVDAALERADLRPDGFVIEVASNDGYLLQHVPEGTRRLGIEPSVNVGDAARERGIPTLTAFLTEKSAEGVRDAHGPADVVIANNVYAHIPDLLGFTRGLRTLLADDGHLVIEVHHALNLVKYAQFDTIYHEHFQYYTLLTITRALATAGLVVEDAEILPTHGGSLRVWARPEGAAAEPSARMQSILADEQAAGLHEVAGYESLEKSTIRVRQNLLRFLLDAAASGQRVAGYGAPGKGNTLLNYCGIRPDLLAYTVDRNPYKHGRFTPGTRIPIHSPEYLNEDKPDVILVLPWNLRDELQESLTHVGEWGARLVFALPELEVVEMATTSGGVRA